MGLCGNMQSDFMHGTGRFDPDTGDELYDAYNLAVGVSYAEDLIGAGFAVDPVAGFDLRAFLAWCRGKEKRP